jgi:hypothetical protein
MTTPETSEPLNPQTILKDIHYMASEIDQSLASRAEMLFLIEMAEIEEQLDGAAIDTLHALFVNGPLYDGDIPSKRGRDFLVENDLVARITVKGEAGYNACTHFGDKMYKFHRHLRELKEQQAKAASISS